MAFVGPKPFCLQRLLPPKNKKQKHSQKAEETPCVLGQCLSLRWPLRGSVTGVPFSPDPKVLVHPQLLSWPLVCQNVPFGALPSPIPKFSGHF